MTTFVNNDVSPGAVVQASDHNTQGSLIAAVLNGGIENANVGASAAIATSKLADDAGIGAAKIADSAITPAKLLTGTGSSWVWQSWTPTWANAAVNNGTVDAKYTQIGKTIRFRILFTLGSTSTIGTNPTFTFPATSVATPNALFPLGIFIYDNNGGSGYNGYTCWASTTTGGLRYFDTNNNLNSVTAVAPTAYASGHKLHIEGTVEAA